MTSFLPFPALVKLELAQQALMLLAIEPRLRGVVLVATAGTGKSSLARGIQALIGDDHTPFVEVPTSIDVENLLGGLDLEATLRAGKIVLQEGVLARANGGFAYIDSVNLMSDASVNLLLSVMDNGEVQVEREGVSLRSSAHFSLISAYDPAEGIPRQHLLDRIGMIVPITAKFDAASRAEVLRRNLLSTPKSWKEDAEFMRGLIITAREHLPHVTIEDSQVEQLSTLALLYGVEGHRVDLFAVYAARASAAYDLRDSVDDDDIQMALRLVILPRATRIPVPPPPENSPPPPPSEPELSDDEEDTDEDAPPPEPPTSLTPPPEQILEALENALPEMLEQLPFSNLRRGKAGSRGSTEGKRGRHVRSVPGDPRRGRIDVVATLRTAAPWQKLRQAQNPVRKARVHLQMSDMRVRQYRSKAGILFCFAVDASGSMALHRMRQAKGAVNHLLEQAYVNRDRVALIAFRGEAAEVLMPPTQSVELARRALDLLPTGGGTPLASALLAAGDLAQQARMRGILQTVVILLTDGRGNIGLKPDSDPQEELQQLGRYIATQANMRVVVVDTKRNYLSRGEAQQLAAWLGADYAYLPNASSEDISNLATHTVETLRA